MQTRPTLIALVTLIIIGGAAFWLATGRSNADPAQEPPGLSARMMSLGETGFMDNCTTCHGASGEGAVGPAFAGNANLGVEGFVPTMALFGGSEMPPFGEVLDDETIAAIATYIRNSWGNSFGPVSASEVADLR